MSAYEPKILQIGKKFSADRATLANTLSGSEPEFVLVVETADRIEDFKRAVENTSGLEWLAEWDEDIEPDDDFFMTPKIGVDFFKGKVSGIEKRPQSKAIQNIFKDQGYIGPRNILFEKDLSELELPPNLEAHRAEIFDAINVAKKKVLKGRLYLSMSSQRGLEELEGLWKTWKKLRKLPLGKAKWREVFEQVTDIRRWGVNEQLIETGILEDWEESLEDEEEAPVKFQIELFYRKSAQQRSQNERDLSTLVNELQGELISNFIDMPEIGFHAVKVKLPALSVQLIIADINSGDTNLSILLYSGIMYYRPTGQTYISVPTEGDAIADQPNEPVSGKPVVAILDGVPFHEHSWLKNRLLVDDVDNLESEYQPGEKRHGTAMASLIIHGELDANEQPLSRPVYFRPILQPEPTSRLFTFREHIPDHVFFEDRVERSVRRMFEGEGNVSAQATSIRIINLSVGDYARQFERTLSPCAKLLDWLSWKYKVLFCVSIGNHDIDIDLGLNEMDFNSKDENEKTRIALSSINDQTALRRLLAPSESINNISIGAMHCDQSNIDTLPRHIDIIPESELPSPINSLGYGFRRSIKPEILFPGGRQLYKPPVNNSDTNYVISRTSLAPGQRVASESPIAGTESGCIYTRGTSNATALATRSAAMINEVVENIMFDNLDKISNTQSTLLVKTLLVHGAMKGENMETLEEYLTPLSPPRKAKEFISKFAGYGSVNVNRILHCTEQRATVIGCGTIGQKLVHEYRLPLPPSLANENKWRRLTITLAWFSPINPGHRYLRQAALSFAPPKEEDSLSLKRRESDPNQVKRGTVQHEILESKRVSDYQDGDYLIIPVKCRADATDNLDEQIDYGIAVTLEVKEDVGIPIYQEIRNRIQAQIRVS